MDVHSYRWEKIWTHMYWPDILWLLQREGLDVLELRWSSRPPGICLDFIVRLNSISIRAHQSSSSYKPGHRKVGGEILPSMITLNAYGTPRTVQLQFVGWGGNTDLLILQKFYRAAHKHADRMEVSSEQLQSQDGNCKMRNRCSSNSDLNEQNIIVRTLFLIRLLTNKHEIPSQQVIPCSLYFLSSIAVKPAIAVHILVVVFFLVSLPANNSSSFIKKLVTQSFVNIGSAVGNSIPEMPPYCDFPLFPVLQA